MLSGVTFEPLSTGTLLVASLLLIALACADKPRLTSKECLDLYDIRNMVFDVADGGDNGSGVLEQRVLEKDLVLWAELGDAEFKAVEKEAVGFGLKGYYPPDYKYTLLIEAELRVREYLRGEGPETITAIVEGQLVFNSRGGLDCAKRVLEERVGKLFSTDQGIALVESTSDPNLYHLGLAYENFKGMDGHHSTWLPYKTGSLVVGGREGVLSLAEMRQRVSSLVEEYNRRDHERWRDCIYGKYWSKGRDPWRYRGISRSYHEHRDHHIIFNGEHVPVPAGTMVWISHERDYRDSLSISRSMSLEGEDADLFEVTYHSVYDYTANRWEGTSGGIGHYLAIWHKPRQREALQGYLITAGHVITTAEDLGEGEYSFYLHIEYGGPDFVDCGQVDDTPRQFKVIVDRDRETRPPAPANVRVLSKDSEGWTIGWDPVDGVGSYWFDVYRLEGDEEVRGAFSRHPIGLTYRIRLADMNGCDDVVYIKIRTEGDGKAYLRATGEPSTPIELRTEPCNP